MSEKLSSPTYDKCHYFVVKALGLADDEEKKFNHRRTKYSTSYDFKLMIPLVMILSLYTRFNFPYTPPEYFVFERYKTSRHLMFDFAMAFY